MGTAVSTLSTRSAQAHAATFSSSQRRIATFVVAIAFVMDLIDATILTIALPTIQRTMHASYAAVNWMAAGYALTFALLLITGGRLGDVFGYKRLFLAGVAGFMVSSMLVGLAWDPTALVLARLCQGAAAALMVPQVLSVIQLLYKPDERVAVTGALGGLTMLATTLAPIATGLLIKADIAGLSWRPIFLLNVPLCLAALPLAARYLPSGRSSKRLTLDIVGAALVTAAVGLLVFPLIQGRDLGWPAWSFFLIGTSAPMFGFFTWWQWRRARTGGSPLVVLSQFRHRSFSAGLAVGLLFSATMVSFGLTFTLLLQIGNGFSAIHTVLTGLFITVGTVPTVAVMGKKIIPALGRYSLTIGIVAMAVGIAAVGTIVRTAGSGLSTWQLAPALIIIGAGAGLVFLPLLPFVLSNVDPNDAGSASGTANAIQQIGGALGIAVVGFAFFGQLSASAGYVSAFVGASLVQIAFLVGGAGITLFLPKRIAADSYKPRL